MSSDPDKPDSFHLNPFILHDSASLYPYKVKSGDTLENIAERVGCDWKELAIINWGTDDPAEINWYLENYFVCEKKIGENYVFSDEDDPGILMLPRELDPAGLKIRRSARASRWQK